MAVQVLAAPTAILCGRWSGELLPAGALRWGDRLFVADLHLGKHASFRRSGVAVPTGGSLATLDRLDALLVDEGIRELVVLGDLSHASSGLTAAVVAAVSAWRRRHASLAITLVRGNHDRGPLPVDWHLEVVDTWSAVGAGVRLRGCHHPQAATGPDELVLAGHEHPGVCLGKRGDQLRLPCFHLRDGCLTLPAFGSGTGLHTIDPATCDEVWVLPRRPGT